ncbi:MAG: SH3 domain-containing protein [Oscillospiraceae bacterium]|nr:SH3 domain-containing protein [Oscillospiraceae bacterium]
MTEQELRQQVVSIITGWKGAKQGSATHKAIIDLYNSQKPLPANYKMTYTDYWCAATASATYLKAGIAEYTGTECSCGRWITLAKKLGMWGENDAHIPQIGDACLYDWDDGPNYKTTDNTGAPEHIGIVTAVSLAGGTFTVTEGNLKKAVGSRVMEINGRYIRGFICPDFEKAARELYGAATSAKPASSGSAAPAAAKKEVKATVAANFFNRGIAGRYEATADLNIRNGPGTSSGVLTTIKKGTTVNNYGYYSTASGHRWLYVQFTQGNVKYTAFASETYLKKQ